MSKRVTRWLSPSLRHCARATKLLSKKCHSGGKAVGNTVSELIDPRFEPQISRSRDERVIARPTGRLTGRMRYCYSSTNEQPLDQWRTQDF